MVEGVAAVAGDVEVGEAVVVVVADRHPHAVAVLRHPGEARLLRDVGEGAVRLLVEEAVPEAGVRLVGPLPRGHGILEPRAVREEDVQPAVLVVVEEGDASAHGLEQVLVRGRGALVLEVDPERRRDLGELDLGRRGGGGQQRATSIGRHPNRRLSTIPFASWTTKRWWAGRSLNVSFRPEGQATSRESAAAARPSPKWRRRSLCE